MCRHIKICLVTAILFVSFSCQNSRPGHSGKLLAAVGDSRFYESDLNISLAGNKDSSAIKNDLIKDWVKKQLIFRKAMENLSDAEKNKDKELKDYYESLVNNEYFDKMVLTNGDTIMNDEEMKRYYIDNRKNFVTKRNILRFMYVKVPVSTHIPENISNWMKHPGKKQMDSIKSFAGKYATWASFDTTTWYYFTDITRKIPVLMNYDPISFVKTKHYAELKDDQYVYIINVVDGRAKDEIAPYSMTKDRISEIILNHRKTILIKEIENQIYRDGESRKLFEISGDNTKK